MGMNWQVAHEGTQAGRVAEHGKEWLACCEINTHVKKPKIWQTFLWRVLDWFFWRSLPLVLPLECYCPSMRPASIVFKEQMRKSSLLVQSNHHSASNKLSWLGFGFFSVLEQRSQAGWMNGGFQEGWTSAEHSTWDQSLQTCRYKDTSHHHPGPRRKEPVEQALNASAQGLTPLMFWLKLGLLFLPPFDRSWVSLGFSRKWDPSVCFLHPWSIPQNSRLFKGHLDQQSSVPSVAYYTDMRNLQEASVTVVLRLNRYKTVCTDSARM